MEDIENTYAIGGCDLSATTDLTCSTLLIRKPNDEKVYVIQHYFLPQVKLDRLDEKTRKKHHTKYGVIKVYLLYVKEIVLTIRK